MPSPNIARFQVDSRHRLLTGSDAQQVADHVARGGLAVLPTDTGYMLSALATDERAVDRVFGAKRRTDGATVHIACDSAAMAEDYGVFDRGARRLLYRTLPGPLSIVVRAQPTILPPKLLLDGTVGIRVPANSAALQVIRAIGAPVTATSVNRSGSPPLSAPTAEQLLTLAWDPSVTMVAFVEDPNANVYNRPSTMVRALNDQLEELRPGPIEYADLLQVFNSTDYADIADWT